MNQSNEQLELQHISDSIEGFLGKHEGPYLYRLARLSAGLGPVVEIGSFKGKSTVWIARACQAQENSRVYAIDPHLGGAEYRQQGNTEQEMRANLRRVGVEELVEPWVMTSMAALKHWSQAIGFLWIDGDHSYEGASQDFYGWSPHVVEGGIIAFHDTYSWEGVRRLVDNEVLKMAGFRVLGQLDGILAIQKSGTLSLRDRVRCWYVRMLRKVFNYARSRRKHWRALPRKLLRGLALPSEANVKPIYKAR